MRRNFGAEMFRTPEVPPNGQSRAAVMLRNTAPQQNLWVDSDELVTGNAWDRSVDAPWGSFG
jgi:hypothetical protein